MSETATCYMCALPETSREHAPPSCFFPDMETLGRDARKNLITVPSCDTHNSKKSKDDEYMRAIVLMSCADRSEAGHKHFMGKFMRGASRNPDAYMKFFAPQGTVAGGTQQAIRLDRSRFDQCADHLVRALTFHTFGRQLLLPLAITSPNFYSGIKDGNVVAHEPTVRIVEATQFLLGNEPLLGENQEIFQYRIMFDAASDSCAFACRYYEHFELYAFASKGLAGNRNARES